MLGYQKRLCLLFFADVLKVLERGFVSVYVSVLSLGGLAILLLGLPGAKNITLRKIYLQFQIFFIGVTYRSGAFFSIELGKSAKHRNMGGDHNRLFSVNGLKVFL